MELSDGQEVRRLPQMHRRAYQSILGAHELHCWAYGSREGQKIEYASLGCSVAVAQGKVSYLLQDWEQALVVENPHGAVREIVQRILGLSVSVHTLEHTNRRLAQSVASYWDNQVAVAPAQGKQLVVGSADGTGR